MYFIFRCYAANKFSFYASEIYVTLFFPLTYYFVTFILIITVVTWLHQETVSFNNIQLPNKGYFLLNVNKHNCSFWSRENQRTLRFIKVTSKGIFDLRKRTWKFWRICQYDSQKTSMQQSKATLHIFNEFRGGEENVSLETVSRSHDWTTLDFFYSYLKSRDN